MADLIHQRVADSLREAIGEGRYPPGTRLPAERDLAVDLGVSRATVRHALDDLQLEGLIVRRRGRSGGAFVQGTLPVVVLNDLAGFLPQLSERGHDVSSTVLVAEKVAARPRVCECLGLQRGTQVNVVSRLRYVDGVPTIVENSCFTARLTPAMTDLDLAGSLYRLLRAQYGLILTRKVESVTPGIAGSTGGGLLGVSSRLPVLKIERIAYAGDTPVEYSLDTLRSDVVSVRVDSWRRRPDLGQSGQ